MKTSAIIALSIVGVLGTAGAAMAVNGATLESFNQSSIGQATDVLVPTADPTNDPTPTSDPTSTPDPTPTPEANDDSRGADTSDGASPTGGGTVDEHTTTPSPSPTHTEDSSDDSSHSGEPEIDD